MINHGPSCFLSMPIVTPLVMLHPFSYSINNTTKSIRQKRLCQLIKFPLFTPVTMGDYSK